MTSTEQRPHTTAPAAGEDEITAAFPRPVGPWAPSVPRARHAAAPARPAWSVPPTRSTPPARSMPPAWSIPPAGLGPGMPAGMPARPGIRPGMRWGWVVIGVVAAIAALTLLGSVVAATRTMTVTGTVTIYGMSGYVTPGASCTGVLATGLPVMIYDASGSLVGSTSLTGTGIARNHWGASSYGYADSCAYSYSISDVPAVDDHYRVTTGRGDGVAFTRDQLASGADITLRP